MKFKYYALKLSGLIILIFIVQIVLSKYGFSEFFLLNKQFLSEPWRLVSSIFLHVNITHLIYNIFALALFGSILEGFIGGRKFLVVFFITGIFANLVSVNFYNNSLGASGAIFGVIGALILVRPMLMVFAFGLPMPIFIAGALWIAGDLMGIFMPSNVANIAHLSGVFFGFIFGAIFRDWKQRRVPRKRIVLDERAVRNWEDKCLR